MASELCAFLFTRGSSFKKDWIHNHYRATNCLSHMCLPSLMQHLGHKTVQCSKSNDSLEWGKCNISNAFYQQVLKLTVIQWHPCSTEVILLFPGNARLTQPLCCNTAKIKKKKKDDYALGPPVQLLKTTETHVLKCLCYNWKHSLSSEIMRSFCKWFLLCRQSDDFSIATNNSIPLYDFSTVRLQTSCSWRIKIDRAFVSIAKVSQATVVV